MNFGDVKLHVILPIKKVANKIIVSSSGCTERDCNASGHGLKVRRRDQGY